MRVLSWVFLVEDCELTLVLFWFGEQVSVFILMMWMLESGMPRLSIVMAGALFFSQLPFIFGVGITRMYKLIWIVGFGFMQFLGIFYAKYREEVDRNLSRVIFYLGLLCIILRGIFFEEGKFIYYYKYPPHLIYLSYGALLIAVGLYLFHRFSFLDLVWRELSVKCYYYYLVHWVYRNLFGEAFGGNGVVWFFLVLSFTFITVNIIIFTGLAINRRLDRTANR